MKKTNKSGFTLVELSIVLVIIGLLIGGILVGQSLIESAKMQSLVRQFGQFDAAIATFKDKFGNLPGDSTLFAVAGDADGLIEASAAATWTGETANAWVQLSQSGLKNEDGVAFTATFADAFVGVNVPKAKAGGSNTGILLFGEGTFTALANLASNANAYIINDCADMTTTTLDCQGGLNGPDAIALDSKLDDGVGTTGNVTGMLGTTDLVDWATHSDGSEAAYVATSTNTDANIVFVRVGSSTGVLE